MNQSNPTPARQAAERIAVRPELQSRHLPCNAREEIIFNIIKQEFATERQQVREAVTKAADMLEHIGELRHIKEAREMSTQLCDVLEKMQD